MTGRNAPAELVDQVVMPVDRERKRELLTSLVRSGRIYQALVFTRTKHGADRLADQLARDGVSAAAIHGNKSQGQRLRVLEAFKANKVAVLVATDIAARGLDIEALPHVVNFELPMVPEDYVHRIGRTGRAGTVGQAISLVCVDEGGLLREIEHLLRRQIPTEVVEGFAPDRSIRPEPIRLRMGAHGRPAAGRSGAVRPAPARPTFGRPSGPRQGGHRGQPNGARPGGGRPNAPRPSGTWPGGHQGPAPRQGPPPRQGQAPRHGNDARQGDPNRQGQQTRYDQPWRAGKLAPVDRGAGPWTGDLRNGIPSRGPSRDRQERDRQAREGQSRDGHWRDRPAPDAWRRDDRGRDDRARADQSRDGGQPRSGTRLGGNDGRGRGDQP